MIPKPTLKFIKSLQLKKYRKLEQCFTIEGDKGVTELLAADFEVILLACTQTYHDSNLELTKNLPKVYVTTEKHLVQAGSLQTNTHALAVARMKPVAEPQVSRGEYVLVLDNISDPGNLGTIIRTCDWYGVKNVIASETTTDPYNPKVINATMGSFCRVNVFYTALDRYLSNIDRPVYGAFLDGATIYEQTFSRGGFILVGSESQGISPEIEKYVTHRITIPKLGEAESLNAAIATGIILDNVMRLKK